MDKPTRWQTVASSREGKIAAALLVVVVVGSILMSRQCSDHDERAAESDGGTPEMRRHVDNFESWIADTANARKGVIRTPVRDCDTGMAGRVTEAEFHSAGPLSRAGAQRLRAFMDSHISSLEIKIERSVTGDLKPTQELSILVEYEEWVIAREQLEMGHYLTIPPGESSPPTPKNCQEIHFTEHELESGGYASVVFVVDRELHKSLRDTYRLYTDLREEERRKKLMEFNAQPFESRDKWVQDYIVLRDKAKGRDPLSAQDLAEWLSKLTLLRGLRAEVSEYNRVLVPSLPTSPRR